MTHSIKMTVWHLNRDLAVAKDLGSNEEHKAPLVDATFGHGHKFGPAVRQLWDARCYEPVAIVRAVEKAPGDGDAENYRHFVMDQAFTLTQHLDTAWNAKVQPLGKLMGPYQCEPLRNSANRSTSVGDIIEIFTENGVRLGAARYYVVCPEGFVALGIL